MTRTLCSVFAICTALFPVVPAHAQLDEPSDTQLEPDEVAAEPSDTQLEPDEVAAEPSDTQLEPVQSAAATSATVLGAYVGATSATNVARAAEPASTRLFRWIALPFVLYTPETSVQFGAVAGVIWRPASFLTLREASTTGISAIYTLKKQISVDSDSSIFLADGLWRVDNDSAFQIYNDEFYGIGPDAYGDAETFDFDGVRIDSALVRSIRGAWYVALEHRFRWYEIGAIEAGGRLASGNFIGAQRDLAHGLGLSGIFDSRDNKATTTRGWYARTSMFGFPTWLGSTQQFGRFELDVRTFATLPWGHVIAGQAFFQGNTGSPGFQSLASLGGAELMRGIYEGRWRDRLAWVLQTEYRAHLFWRFGAVAFGGIGDVADTFAGFGPEPIKWNIGGGLRLALSEEEGVYGRADVGYSPTEVGLYIAIGQAF